MPKIAIIAALKREIAALISGKGWRRSELVSAVYGCYESEEALVVCSGVGGIPARKAAEDVLAATKPSLLLSVGLAGALAPDLKVGQVIIPATIVYADAGDRPCPIDLRTIRRSAGLPSGAPGKPDFGLPGWETGCHAGRPGPHTQVLAAWTPPRLPALRQAQGRLWTPALQCAGILVSASGTMGAGEKRLLAGQYHAQAVDMEAAPVAEVAAMHDIPFAAVKAISDEYDFPMPELDFYVDAQGRFSIGRFVLQTVLHPNRWAVVRQLASNSRRASEELCRVLRILLRSQALAGAS